VADLRDEALALAETAISLVTAAGASDADATVSIVDRFGCQARDREQRRVRSRPVHGLTRRRGAR
jgi:hypothetical protein